MRTKKEELVKFQNMSKLIFSPPFLKTRANYISRRGKQDPSSPQRARRKNQTVKSFSAAAFYLRRSRQVKASSVLFWLLLLLWGDHFSLPMCFQKRCVQRGLFPCPCAFKKGVFREVCSKRCVQRALNLVSPK